MPLPPGLVFVRKHIQAISLPPIVVATSLYALKRRNALSLPTWAMVALVAAAKPIHYLLVWYTTPLLHRRRAKKLGARVVPHLKENGPYFGMSIIQEMMESLEGGYILDFLSDWTTKFGNTFELRLPFERQIVTVEPEHIKALLATKFDTFEKGEDFIEQNNSFLGTGVFNSDSEMWKFHRSMTRPFFSKERISDFDIFDKHGEEALSLAKKRLAEGHAIDFQDLVARFTLDSASKFLLGRSIDSLGAGLPYPRGLPNPTQFTCHSSNIFVDGFFQGLNEVTIRGIIGLGWELREFFKDQVSPYRAIVDSIIEPIVDEAVTRHLCQESKDEEEGEGNLLSSLVAQTQDRTVLKDEILNLLVAGRDTTAATLSFALYSLTQYPHIAERLRAEVLEKVGEQARPTYDHIREMKYLRAFLNEVLRLYPAVGINIRRANKDTVLPNKDGSTAFFVPAETQVVYSVLVMHRRKDLWGDDAEDFDPDRFLDERLTRMVKNPYIFVPFNAGPRICLGQQFAYNEMSFFLIRLLQQFSKFALDSTAQPPESLPPASWAGSPGMKGREKVVVGSNLTLFVKGGLWVRME